VTILDGQGKEGKTMGTGARHALESCQRTGGCRCTTGEALIEPERTLIMDRTARKRKADD